MPTTKMLLIVTLLAVSAQATALQAKERNRVMGKTPELDPTMQQARVAAELALRAQKHKSPILALAALELLSPLKTGDRKSDVVEESPKVDKDAASAGVLSVKHLIAMAREYAAGDAELSEYIEKRMANLNSRGLVYNQGKDMRSYKLAGKTFKVVSTGRLNPGQTYYLHNVVMEAKEPAQIVIIGDGDGDLDLWVYDENGHLMDDDTDASSIASASWVPKWEGKFVVKVKNVGSIYERFYVLVNW